MSKEKTMIKVLVAIGAECLYAFVLLINLVFRNYFIASLDIIGLVLWGFILWREWKKL